ncbi:MAG TPA: EscU/YscU/HrcU family type III secretion system export apparatus switch protein [Polyangia bacterium]|jgi:flagellar biosynthesis protein FlhB|nr:EscU/YscU/HrcU family type III secretion system export apparatus switch protein [Polyangia bacterium]
MARRGGGQPTEEPTPKRLADARRQGQVAVSRELAGAFSLAAAFTALMIGAPSLVAGLIIYMRQALAVAQAGGAPGPALQTAITSSGRALLAPVAAALAAALIVNLIQTRGLFAMEVLRPDLGRLTSASSLRRLFGGQALTEMAKGLAKVAVVAAIAWMTVRPLLSSVTALTGAPPVRALTGFGEVAGRLGLRVVVAMLVIGVADYLLVRSRHHKEMRMTREEVKREYKESEGDPHHRAERQRLHRDLAQQRMVADVRKADFVVVNPDHLAVALRYDRETQAAPVVVAKGERLLAERIKQVAREAGVPIFRDVSLARSLRDVQEGDEIPEALYEAAAEIVRTVLALNQPAQPAQPSQPTGGDVNSVGGGAVGAPGSAPGTVVSSPGAGFTWKRV